MATITKMLRALALCWLLLISPAIAGDIYNPGASSMGDYPDVDNPSGGSTFSLALASSSSVTSGTQTSPITYTSLTWSTTATRIVLAIAATTGTNGNPTAVTLGGNSLSHIASSSAGCVTSGQGCTDFWISSGTLSGGSGSAVVTYAANTAWASAVAVYNVNTSTPTPGTPGTGHNGSSGASVTTSSFTVPSGGGGAVVYTAAAGSDATFTGATIDTDITSSGNHYIFGHTNFTGAGTVTANYTSDIGSISAVPWGP